MKEKFSKQSNTFENERNESNKTYWILRGQIKERLISTLKGIDSEPFEFLNKLSSSFEDCANESEFLNIDDTERQFSSMVTTKKISQKKLFFNYQNR